MPKLALHALLLGAAVTLGACGNETKAEDSLKKGQVVATVDGEDITVYELNAELQGLNLPNGERRRAVEKAALQRMIERKLLASIARERGLEKTPDYLLQKRLADENILVSLLRRDVARKVPPVSDEEAERYVADHPLTFGERKIWVVDQIQFPAPADTAALKSYEPLKTLDQIEAKLTADGTPFRRIPTSIDTLQISPENTRRIAALPPGEVFITPVGSGLSANLITETRASPVTGNDALQLAKSMIQRQKLVDSAKAELEPMVKQAKAEVRYQPGYAPDAPKGPATARPN